MVKYWDGDRFVMVLELKGHSADLWGLAMSRNGDFVATAGNDKSIRVCVPNISGGSMRHTPQRVDVSPT